MEVTPLLLFVLTIFVLLRGKNCETDIIVRSGRECATMQHNPDYRKTNTYVEQTAAYTFARDPDQFVLDLSTYYVTLSTTSHSSIHCALLCINMLGTCAYYVFNATEKICYGRKNMTVIETTQSHLVNVTSLMTKMVEVTDKKEEFRSCVRERSGILVGHASCIFVTDVQVKGNAAATHCQKNYVGGQLFEPRSNAISENYKLPMIERGYNEENTQFWIGLQYQPRYRMYTWLTDDEEAGYTDWYGQPDPQPDYPNSQFCIATVFRQLKGTYNWWDKKCSDTKRAVCDSPP